MDEWHRNAATELRGMSSQQAADWLLNTLPPESEDAGKAVTLIPHRSWERPDQDRLASAYLGNLPHASARAYKAFLSFMSVPRFLRAIEGQLPSEKERISLLRYYLEPSLKNASKSARDDEIIRRFLRGMKTSNPSFNGTRLRRAR